MPARHSDLVNAIYSGTAQQVNQLLDQGVAWPKNKADHAVFDIFNAAFVAPYTTELPQKLAAFLEHGIEVDFHLHPRLDIFPSRKMHGCGAGLWEHSRLSEKSRLAACGLMERAAGVGRADLMEVLHKKGANATPLKRLYTEPAPVVAAIQEQMDALKWLVEKFPSRNGEEWGKRVAHALTPALRQKREDIIELLARDLPPLDAQQGHDALQALCNAPYAGIAWLLEKAPYLWGVLHDAADFPTKEGYYPSLWKTALALAVEHGPTHPVFKQALSHAKARGTLDRPIASINSPRFFVESPASAYAPQVAKWENQSVPLPPLQALLHATSSSRKKVKNIIKVARSLQKAGAAAWMGNNARGKPLTEAMLLDRGRHHFFNASLLRHYPQILDPHPDTGRNVLHETTRVVHAQQWIALGADPGHVDHNGNQALSTLSARMGRHHTASLASVDTPAQWAEFFIQGWGTGQLPLEGQAWGKTLGEWACARSDTLEAYRKKGGVLDKKREQALQVACYNLNTPGCKWLLERGHEPGAQDERGWDAWAHLASVFHHSLDGQEERLFTRIQSLLAPHAAMQPALVGRILMSAPYCILQNPNSFSGNGPQAVFFRQVHELRTQSQHWGKEDAGLVFSNFKNEGSSELKTLPFLTRTLPTLVMDDLLLALLDPSRWGKESHHTYCTHGQAIAQHLLSQGATWEGQTLDGRTAVDLWPALDQLHRQHTEEDTPHRRLHDVMETPQVRIAYESQVLAKNLHANTASTFQKPRARL